MAARRPKSGEIRDACTVCRLALTEQGRDRLLIIEERLALGESASKVAREFGLHRMSLTRHWNSHADRKSSLKRAHRRAEDGDVKALLADTARLPTANCCQQIARYRAAFERAWASGEVEERDRADKHLFHWTKLLHQIQVPLHAQYGPQVNVHNNTIIAGAGPDFGALLSEFERRLALHPPEKRAELVALLREDEVIDVDVE
jgi:transposase-like protein